MNYPTGYVLFSTFTESNVQQVICEMKPWNLSFTPSIQQ